MFARHLICVPVYSPTHLSLYNLERACVPLSIPSFRLSSGGGGGVGGGGAGGCLSY